MEIDWKIFAGGFVITLIIFVAILYSNTLMNTTREDTVVTRMKDVVQEYEDMQAVLWMSEFLGQESSCIALNSMISRMNQGLWDLGGKIDQYRQVTEEFATDPFYIDQKREFNRQEVLYFSTLKGLKDRCHINQTVLSYFYLKKEECPDCDAQSFVLLDIKKDLENMDKSDELAIFSFDANMDLATIELLTKYYNLTSYPCIVIEDKVYCGLYDKQALTEVLCNTTNLSICKQK
jgi:hypothetical protein